MRNNPEALSQEKELKKYIYRDNRTNEHKTVFECVAEDILEADKRYEAATGHKPEKQSYIGCEIIFIEEKSSLETQEQSPE